MPDVIKEGEAEFRSVLASESSEEVTAAGDVGAGEAGRVTTGRAATVSSSSLWATFCIISAT